MFPTVTEAAGPDQRGAYEMMLVLSADAREKHMLAGEGTPARRKEARKKWSTSDTPEDWEELASAILTNLASSAPSSLGQVSSAGPAVVSSPNSTAAFTVPLGFPNTMSGPDVSCDSQGYCAIPLKELVG